MTSIFRIRIALAAALACSLHWCAPAAQAASPSLGATSPRGAQRGTEVEVVLSGGQLEDAQEILFYEPGIEVAKFEVVNPATVKVVFKIAPECMLGSHRL